MKITLHDRTAAHVKTYFQKTSNPQIDGMLPRSFFTLEDALAAFEKTKRPDADSFGRTIYADGKYVGDVWCYGIAKGEDPEAMLSFCIFEPEYWGKGIMTEAVTQFLAEVFELYPISRIGAFCYESNTASARVLEKCGFALEERFSEDGTASRYYLYQK